MDAYGLNQFSNAFGDKLFAQFPEWRSLARFEPAGDATNYLQVEVAAPAAASAAYGLTVTTADSVVTIGFDYYHGHFSSCVGDGERVGVDYALHFLSQLLAEEVAVVSWWSKGELVAFSTIENGTPQLPEELVGSYDLLRIRSWKGTLNADRSA